MNGTTQFRKIVMRNANPKLHHRCSFAGQRRKSKIRFESREIYFRQPSTVYSEAHRRRCRRMRHTL